MRDTATWAFWRRVQYGTAFGLFWILVFTAGYFKYFYEPANCFDGKENGDERGIDCGGGCLRICASDVIPPTIRWAQSFRVTDGQYNAVGYVENINQQAVAPEVSYNFSLYDNDGLITEAKGTTALREDSVYPVFVGRIDTGERVPTKTFLELDPIEVWLPPSAEPNQFTVVDRKLLSADARPRLEATLVNNALTPASDVEIVATIFDARGNALTSSRTFVEYFAERSEQEVVFTWPEPIAKTVRSCEVPTDVVVAIDLSGSMNNDQADPPEPVSSVLRSADAFVSRLRSNDQVALVTFATEAMTKRPLTSDTATVRSSIKSLEIDPSEETGSTNTGDAFLKALKEFDSPRHSDDARKVMVILTDGLATAPDEEPELYAKQTAALLKASGAEIYAIGLGEEVNMDFVREIATTRNYAFQALSSGQVDQIYRTITGAICEDGPAVIDIIPKTKVNSIN